MCCAAAIAASADVMCCGCCCRCCRRLPLPSSAASLEDDTKEVEEVEDDDDDDDGRVVRRSKSEPVRAAADAGRPAASDAVMPRHRLLLLPAPATSPLPLPPIPGRPPAGREADEDEVEARDDEWRRTRSRCAGSVEEEEEGIAVRSGAIRPTPLKSR